MRFWLLIGIVWTTLAVFPQTTVRAADLAFAEKADDHGKKDDHGHDKSAREKEAEKKHGEGVFKGALDLGIWTVVVFVLLVGVLRVFAWGPISQGLDKRESDIARDKAEAVAARAEAEKSRAELQAEMSRAQDQIRQMIDKARLDAEATAAEQLARGKAELQAERERLTRDMTTSRDQAVQEVWTQASQLATLISAKTIRRQLTPDDHRQLVDEALAEFRSAAEDRKRDLLSARA